MTRPRVFLAVGHGLTPEGRHDPGATGHGWTEQTAGDVIVATAAVELDRLGAAVRHEADSADPNYRGTARNANAWGADAVVAVHHDVASAPAGAFAYHAPGSARGAELASTIIRTAAGTGWPTRRAWLGPGRGFAAGPVAPRSLHVLTHTTMPAALVEVGPIGAHDHGELTSFGEALAVALALYLNIQPEDDDVPPSLAVYVNPRAPLPDGLAALGALAAARHPGSVLCHDVELLREWSARGVRVLAVGSRADLDGLPRSFERLSGRDAAETIGAAAASTRDW